jgi:hypothetical protein
LKDLSAIKHLVILVPVYNDQECLELFCNHPVFNHLSIDFTVLVVNDGSSNFDFKPERFPYKIEVLNLKSNLGHQKALAIGLSYILHHRKTSHVVLMDVDGEDNPWHIEALLECASETPETVITAKRMRRKEKQPFRSGYQLYKLVFRVLTGKKIGFGNFLLLPFSGISRLVYRNEAWNHLAAAVIKSGIPRRSLSLERNVRFAGESKMNFNRLVLHGLGAVTVFIETVTTRLLISSLILLFVTSVTILTVIIIRSFTNLAIPGWASTVTAVMFVIFLQSFLLTLFTLLLYLSSQSQRQFIPGIDYKEFIDHLKETV